MDGRQRNEWRLEWKQEPWKHTCMSLWFGDYYYDYCSDLIVNKNKKMREVLVDKGLMMNVK